MQQPVREYFPLTDTFITPDNYEERAAYAFEKPGLPSYREAYNGYPDFYERFGFVPNAVRQEVMDIVSDVSSAGIYILEAPMGLWKTEAWRIRRLRRILHTCAGRIRLMLFKKYESFLQIKPRISVKNLILSLASAVCSLRNKIAFSGV